MSLRDTLIIAIVLLGALAALRRPWIGVLLWTWLSIMNPHRFAWGVAYDAPLAAIAAVSTLLGALITRDKASPFKGAPVVLFTLFTIWLTLSWLMGIDPDNDYWQWNKVIKINFMILVGLALLHPKQHIFALTWVAAGSLALLGFKGGLFTVLTGGNFRVWGPSGSFIEDNNEFALAVVMAIPMLRFLQLQLVSRWGKHALTLTMVLCAASALGSHSRGGLLAITAMTAVLWWRGRSRVLGGIVIVTCALSLLAFMPESWSARMSTIESSDYDASVIGRFSAWWTAWGVAKNYPFGAGFEVARPELVAMYSPYPTSVHAAHSIYFQVLGNHGFVGLFLFILIGATTWSSTRWLRRHTLGIPQARWAHDLASMAQVSMVGYAVGGAFLSLSYFDLPYIIMSLVVLTRVWVHSRAWEREPPVRPRWWAVPGLAMSTAKSG